VPRASLSVASEYKATTKVRVFVCVWMKKKEERIGAAVAPALSPTLSRSLNHSTTPPLHPKQNTTTQQGERASTDFRIFLESAKAPGTPISTWHDIPLRNPDGTLNFVTEIPMESSAKMEVSTKEDKNPIKQDIKKGALRFYPYNINWNYGMLPQTWEDPKHVHPELEVAVS
jgi:inorganic pyrophosphatase